MAKSQAINVTKSQMARGRNVSDRSVEQAWEVAKKTKDTELAVIIAERKNLPDKVLKDLPNQKDIEVKTAYTAGATLKIGYTEDDDALLETGDISLQETGKYTVRFINKAWHTEDRQLIATISDTPVAGELYISVDYCNPNK
jgi:hypothetical protein